MPSPALAPLVGSLRTSALVVAVLWILHLLQRLVSVDLGVWGIYPRTVSGLRGILLGPWIHGDWAHLISNTPPLFALLTLVTYFYRRVAIPAFFLIFLLTGLGVWVFGRPVFHIGASGVVYGLVAFVFWLGVFRRNGKSIALALLVAFYYGSMVLGVLPGQSGISWESHLLGALAGVFTAFLLRDFREPSAYRERLRQEVFRHQEKTYFLPRETFKGERADDTPHAR